MIVVYRGRGIWAFLLILGMVTVCAVGAVPFLDTHPIAFPLASAFGLLAAGTGCWILGRRWNAEAKGQDTLYLIPVRYWGVICLLAAAALLSVVIYQSFIRP